MGGGFASDPNEEDWRVRRPSGRLIVTWDDVSALCRELTRKLPRPVRTIAPISRGGLVPATILSYATGVPIGFAIFPAAPYLVRSDRDDILVVDEIADTGRTLREVRDHFPRAVLAALYVKPPGAALCDVYAREAPAGMWLTFPWGE